MKPALFPNESSPCSLAITHKFDGNVLVIQNIEIDLADHVMTAVTKIMLRIPCNKSI